MSPLWLLAAIILIALIGALMGRNRALGYADGDVAILHSRPGYYGSYVFIWTAIPAALFMAAFLIAQPFVNQSLIHDTLLVKYDQACIQAQSASGGQDSDEVARICKDHSDYKELTTRQALVQSVVGNVADGLVQLSEDETKQLYAGTQAIRPLMAQYGIALAENVSRPIIDAAARLNEARQTGRLLLNIGLGLLLVAGFFFSYLRIKPQLRARNLVEANIKIGLILASSIAILTTIGIVLSMLFEALNFFRHVELVDFFFGTVWDPRFSSAASEGGVEAGQFGLLPLLWGTMFISLVALLVAVPIGLFAAIYMAEYASRYVRSIAKPMLEILAGIPTIVYGFFALVTIGPFLRDAGAVLGLSISANSVLTAGFVMGIMLIPFISSLSDDIITAVPQSLRDGSLGLGATKSETIKRVVLPAALPGIVGSILLAASRAIGETMIVVMAAGIAANLTANPFEAVTTVTVKIVSQLTGDLEFNSPQTLVAFALGITLFVITLGLNVFALHIVRKYREQYD
ncbi:MAG: phosphate ABC transporter permease subunit PstC [Cohaesibacter sp.]|jgi:phosphate transport system permease protein|nr:phosphate ABC transporter permease subunit PstC [Cohaesibacter sp.]